MNHARKLVILLLATSIDCNYASQDVRSNGIIPTRSSTITSVRTEQSSTHVVVAPLEAHVSVHTPIDQDTYIVSSPVTDPQEFAAMKKKFDIMMEVLAHLENDALDRPKNLSLCITEMLAMHPNGECRDRWTHYESADDAIISAEDHGGEISGIGAHLESLDGAITIIAPMPNSPAERAGLKPGDIITKVDGKETGSLTKTVNMIRGPTGTTIKLTIVRKGNDEPFEVMLTREKIEVAPVIVKILPKHPTVGIIKVSGFAGNTAEKFDQAITNLETHGIRNLVIDLRNNPGGLVATALEMLSNFAEADDTLLTLHYRTESRRIAVNDAELLRDHAKLHLREKLRVVVLINKGSASASEIFAGTMKDWGYPIVGETSFGKGVGQSVFPLGDGGTFTLTTFEFLVGNHAVPVRDKGVTPTVAVKQSNGNKKDTQIEKAIEILLKK